MRIPYLCLLVFLVSGLFSCSTLKIARTYADWYILSELDDAFDLESDQEEYLRLRVEDHLNWFDHDFIYDIIHFADVSLDLADKKQLTPDTIQKSLQSYNKIRLKLITRIAPDAAWLFPMLSAAQIKNLEDYIKERSEKTQKLLAMNQHDFAKELQKQRIDRIEEWFGDLTLEQKKKLSEIWPPSKEQYENWVQTRQKREENLISLIKTTKDPQIIHDTLIQWAQNPNLMQDPSGQTPSLSKDKELSYKITATVFNDVLNTKQKIFFQKKVGKMRHELKKISKT